FGGWRGLAARGERGCQKGGGGEDETMFHASETSRRDAPAQRSSRHDREPHFRLGFAAFDPI
ncbi:MAG TPA: hypothetical protein VN034_00510, partial [Sphingopyxis sp.]|nr:hypothetical protein [Sphingopyxis sp.]